MFQIVVQAMHVASAYLENRSVRTCVALQKTASEKRKRLDIS